MRSLHALVSLGKQRVVRQGALSPPVGSKLSLHPAPHPSAQALEAEKRSLLSVRAEVQGNVLSASNLQLPIYLDRLRWVIPVIANSLARACVRACVRVCVCVCVCVCVGLLTRLHIDCIFCSAYFANCTVVRQIPWLDVSK